MKVFQRIRNILAEHKEQIKDKFDVKEIGVFGSYVRGQQNKRSDIDILVEFKQPVGLFEFMDLEEYLENLLKIDVDLVSKKALKPRIGEYILREVVYI